MGTIGHDGMFTFVPMPCLVQRLFTQSWSSGQSSSVSQVPGRMHLPDRHLPSGPHSPSLAQVEHLLFLQTSNTPQSPSLAHQPACGSHMFVLPQTWPSLQSMLSRHWTHFLFTHFSGALQSLSRSQVGYLGLPPHAAAANTTHASRNHFRQGLDMA